MNIIQNQQKVIFHVISDGLFSAKPCFKIVLLKVTIQNEILFDTSKNSGAVKIYNICIQLYNVDVFTISFLKKDFYSHFEYKC